MTDASKERKFCECSLKPTLCANEPTVAVASKTSFPRLVVNVCDDCADEYLNSGTFEETST